MTILVWIIVVSIAGGALSVLAAASFALTFGIAWLTQLVSFAIGALLGAAFLEVLPEAIAATADAETTSATVLAGILAFFVLEKLVLWRHCHTEACEGHEHLAAQPKSFDGGRSGLLILVGDTFHNFVDGVLIAAAFMENIQLGIVTALAIIAHEIPQEVGDFVILLHSGYSRAKALAYNLLSSFATVVGGLLSYFALSSARSTVPVFLALGAASMIYVAVADLIPGLHKRTGLKESVQQVLLICGGVATIWLSHRLVDRLMG